MENTSLSQDFQARTQGRERRREIGCAGGGEAREGQQGHCSGQRGLLDEVDRDRMAGWGCTVFVPVTSVGSVRQPFRHPAMVNPLTGWLGPQSGLLAGGRSAGRRDLLFHVLAL